MSAFRTHYDNLRVRRDASPQEIRAAFRALSLKYHPDQNSNDPDAVRIMRILIEAYDVLKDPRRRQQHDQWIKDFEARSTKGHAGPLDADADPQAANDTDDEESRPYWEDDDFDPTPLRRQAEGRPAEGATRGTLNVLAGTIVLGASIGAIGIVASVLMAVFGDPSLGPSARSSVGVLGPEKTPLVAPRSSESIPSKPQLSWIRPAKAPNGRSWPAKTGYVSGYPLQFTDGRSRMTIDNRNGNADVFLKLYALGSKQPIQVRTALIRRGDQLEALNLRPGQYELRYQNLESGKILRSEPFDVEERKTRAGVEVSVISVTLYDVEGGSFEMTEIESGDF